MAETDLHVVACTTTGPTGSVSAGTLAYVRFVSADGLVPVLVREKPWRWVETWKDPRELTGFRVATVSTAHPLYRRLRDGLSDDIRDDLDTVVADLNLAATRCQATVEKPAHPEVVRG